VTARERINCWKQWVKSEDDNNYTGQFYSPRERQDYSGVVRHTSDRERGFLHSPVADALPVQTSPRRKPGSLGVAEEKMWKNYLRQHENVRTR
jgi:hypothetical protein